MDEVTFASDRRIEEFCERLANAIGKSVEEVRAQLEAISLRFGQVSAGYSPALNEFQKLKLQAPAILPPMNRHERRKAAKLARRRKR
jgi:hypothetical protein